MKRRPGRAEADRPRRPPGRNERLAGPVGQTGQSGPRGPASGPGQIRIIGGAWRGSRVTFPAAPGLRPTPDRVRETLFNWLAPLVEGSVCLDLCAGAGGLGLEALSRGARRVVFVDSAPAAVAELKATLARLPALGEADLRQTDVIDFLRNTPAPDIRPDVVFIDPPYATGLAPQILRALSDSAWSAPGQRIYLEHDAPIALPDDVPLAPYRTRRAGQVHFGLWRLGFTAGADAS